MSTPVFYRYNKSLKYNLDNWVTGLYTYDGRRNFLHHYRCADIDTRLALEGRTTTAVRHPSTIDFVILIHSQPKPIWLLITLQA